jgi:Protein of unknown function (DUF3551)
MRSKLGTPSSPQRAIQPRYLDCCKGRPALILHQRTLSLWRSGCDDQAAYGLPILLASGKGGHRFLRNDGGPIEKQKSKGGSHLCAANHCGRYRPAARHAQRVDTSTSHLGFPWSRSGPINPRPNGDKVMFRTLVISTVLGVATMVLAQGSATAQGRWCAQYSTGGTNCGFNTYRQCRSDIRGVGGSCRRNLSR